MYLLDQCCSVQHDPHMPSTKPAADMTNQELRRAWLYLDETIFRLGIRTPATEARFAELDREWTKRGCP